MADSKAHVELQAEVVRLAELSLLEYDQVRERAAEEMGVRVSTLDAEVKKARAAAEGDADQQGKAIEVHEAEPWADKVDIAELLDDIDDTVHHYVVLPKKAADAVTLWIAGTYTLDAAAFAARLYLFSPVKRCGKTTLLTVITRLAHRALPGSNISAAALFRTIEAVQPTLIIDEADTLTMSDELRSILNSGHSRDLAFVIRTCGEDHEPRQFSTFALLAIATKSKRLPDTVEDRSIGIGMRRRGANEDKPPRLPPRGKGEFAKLRRKLARWAQDNLDALRDADPQDIPESLNDRAVDNWLHLFAIADLAGGDWPRRARKDATCLSSDGVDSDGEEIGVLLLADIRAYFAKEKNKGAEQITSNDLAHHLEALSERPWKEWGKGAKPISKHQVARLLRPFGIAPSDVHDERGNTRRGYVRTLLGDAFERYLPSDTFLQSARVRETVPDEGNSASSRARGNAGAHSEKTQREPYPSRSAHSRTPKRANGADDEGIVDVRGFSYRRPTAESIRRRLRERN